MALMIYYIVIYILYDLNVISDLNAISYYLNATNVIYIAFLLLLLS